MYCFLNIGILTTAISMYYLATNPELANHFNSAGTRYSLTSLVISFISCLNAYAWVMFFFGLSQKVLNFNSKLLQSLNVAILPIYILHQTVIVVIGYYIVQFELSIMTKFLIIFIIVK